MFTLGCHPTWRANPRTKRRFSKNCPCAPGWWFDLPLWKIWVRQLGWWNSQYMEKIKFMFQTTNQLPNFLTCSMTMSKSEDEQTYHSVARSAKEPSADAKLIQNSQIVDELTRCSKICPAISPKSEVSNKWSYKQNVWIYVALRSYFEEYPGVSPKFEDSNPSDTRATQLKMFKENHLTTTQHRKCLSINPAMNLQKRSTKGICMGYVWKLLLY